MGETIFAPTAALHLWSNVSDFPGNVKFSMQIRLLAYDNGTLGIVVFLFHLFPVVSSFSSLRFTFPSNALLPRTFFMFRGRFAVFSRFSSTEPPVPLGQRGFGKRKWWHFGSEFYSCFKFPLFKSLKVFT